MKTSLVLIIWLLFLAYSNDDPPAKKAYKKGEEYLKKGKYDEALKEVNNALSIDSLYADAYLLRAKIFRELNEQSNADNDIFKYVKIDSNNVQTYRNASFALLDYFIEAGETIVEKRLDKALEYYERIIMIEPNKADSYINIATLLELYCTYGYKSCKETQQTSLKLYSYALSIDSTNIEALFRRGSLKYDMRNYIDACQDFKNGVNAGKQKNDNGIYYLNCSNRLKEVCGWIKEE